MMGMRLNEKGQERTVRKDNSQVGEKGRPSHGNKEQRKEQSASVEERINIDSTVKLKSAVKLGQNLRRNQAETETVFTVSGVEVTPLVATLAKDKGAFSSTFASEAGVAPLTPFTPLTLL